MSRDYNNIIKEIQAKTAEIYEKSHQEHDIEIKNIKNMLLRMDAKLNEILNKVNEFNILLHEIETDEEETDEEDWNPYNSFENDEDFYDDYESGNEDI